MFVLIVVVLTFVMLFVVVSIYVLLLVLFGLFVGFRLLSVAEPVWDSLLFIVVLGLVLGVVFGDWLIVPLEVVII